MKVKEAARRVERYIEGLDYALDCDPLANLALRVERLERQVADLSAARPA